ncbi:TPA: HlyD family type I secretion periplasmic adaptor subunit [Escherichia coli]|nr:HlyD family type I secretion periplasmic adaptor subunit [Escherichia coli]
MKIWISEIKYLLKKYTHLFKEIWSFRKDMAPPLRKQDEYDFLPAHLELIERPVSPTPRMISLLIILFLVISVVISILFHVEIVAVSSGKLELSGRSKTIQPFETSLVKKVYVKDGETVKKGQLLIALSAIGIDADRAKIESALSQAKLTEKRQYLLLQAIEKNKLPDLEFESKQNDLNYDILRSEQLLKEQFTSWMASRAQQDAVIRQRTAEKESIESNIKKLNGQKKIVFEKLNDISKLYSKQAISKHEYLNQENLYIDISNEINIQSSRLKEVSAAILQANEEYELLLKTFRRDTLEQLNQTKETINQLNHDFEKIKEREQALNIKSPVDGVVQQVTTFTEGGVVTTAQSLMVIVPENEKLSAKIMIANKDIGFIRVGQPVIIKIEAFPYTKYGYIHGKVKTVSSESIEDKEKGLYFDGYITLEQSSINIDGKDVSLTSGMSITAEIITGYRRVIDFILSPFEETINESLGER